MQLWTHHPPDVRLDDPKFKLDHTKGDYWNDDDNQAFRRGYRKALARLQSQLGSDQLLWCCTKQYQYELTDYERDTLELERNEWEIEAPFRSLTFCDEGAWRMILDGGSDWENVIVNIADEREVSKVQCVSAVLCWPNDGIQTRRVRDMLRDPRRRCPTPLR